MLGACPCIGDRDCANFSERRLAEVQLRGIYPLDTSRNEGEKEAETPRWDPGPVNGGPCSTGLSATRRPEAYGVAPLEGFLIRGAQMHVQMELAKAR